MFLEMYAMWKSFPIIWVLILKRMTLRVFFKVISVGINGVVKTVLIWGMLWVVLILIQASWYNGTSYGVYRREFLQEAVLGGKVAPIREILLQHQAFVNPEEFYFPILAYNPHFGLPGSCLNEPPRSKLTILSNLAKFVIKSDYNIRCTTKYLHHDCVLGNAHVPLLMKVPHLFASKFLVDFEQEAYTKLEQWYFQRLQYELNEGTFVPQSFNVSLYANRWCSRNHIWLLESVELAQLVYILIRKVNLNIWECDRVCLSV